MSITRSLLVAALLIAVSSAPALSNACDSASWKAKSGNFASLVERINGAGFAHLADLRQQGTGDVAVSPFAIWYLDEFLSRSWQTASNDAVVALLQGLAERTGMHATVWADPLGTSFSKADAAAVARGLCATTKWPPWDFRADADAALIRPEPHGLNLVVYMYLEFAPVLDNPAGVPSYASDALRAIRLDSRDDRVSVFLVWPAANDKGASWLNDVTYERWRLVTSQFRDAAVSAMDLPLELGAYTEIPATQGTAFDTEVEPGLMIDRALIAYQNLSISRQVVYMDIAAMSRAFSPKPIRIGPSTFEGHDYYRIRDAGQVGPKSPPTRPVPAPRPLMYLVVDRQTGAILLLGVRE
jgi:hypothetical protein